MISMAHQPRNQGTEDTHVIVHRPLRNPILVGDGDEGEVGLVVGVCGDTVLDGRVESGGPEVGVELRDNVIWVVLERLYEILD